MCLKYFVEHTTCDHHEYLGSHHCSPSPCDLDTQHFHYIRDSFPVPWSSALRLSFQTDRDALACTTCAAKHRDELDPDEVPVQYYSSTNNFHIEELRPTGYSLPIKVVRAETEGMENCECDYDYKSLSDADEEGWNMLEEQSETTEVHVADNEIMAQMPRDFIQGQLKGLPDYVTQQRQVLSFEPPGLTLEAYAMGNYVHYPLPHTAYLVPPSILTMPQWHGNVLDLSFAHLTALPPHPGDPRPPPMLPLAYAVEPEITATLPQRPATPPATPPTHPLPRRATPPFIVGSITDAYLRMEAAKRRHMRERARRANSSLRDALPARSMALTDFMVNRRNRKGHHKDVEAAGDTEADTWSSLPFAGEDSDTEGGAEEYTGIVESGEANCRFSCRLVT